MLSDDSVMSFGVHMGKRLCNVPADYLLWVLDAPWSERKYPNLVAYIRDNKECLEKEVAGDLKGMSEFED